MNSHPAKKPHRRPAFQPRPSQDTVAPSASIADTSPIAFDIMEGSNNARDALPSPIPELDPALQASYVTLQEIYPRLCSDQGPRVIREVLALFPGHRIQTEFIPIYRRLEEANYVPRAFAVIVYCVYDILGQGSLAVQNLLPMLVDQLSQLERHMDTMPAHVGGLHCLYNHLYGLYVVRSTGDQAIRLEDLQGIFTAYDPTDIIYQCFVQWVGTSQAAQQFNLHPTPQQAVREIVRVFLSGARLQDRHLLVQVLQNVTIWWANASIFINIRARGGDPNVTTWGTAVTIGAAANQIVPTVRPQQQDQGFQQVLRLQGQAVQAQQNFNGQRAERTPPRRTHNAPIKAELDNSPYEMQLPSATKRIIQDQRQQQQVSQAQSAYDAQRGSSTAAAAPAFNLPDQSTAVDGHQALSPVDLPSNDLTNPFGSATLPDPFFDGPTTPAANSPFHLDGPTTPIPNSPFHFDDIPDDFKPNNMPSSPPDYKPRQQQQQPPSSRTPSAAIATSSATHVAQVTTPGTARAQCKRCRNSKKLVCDKARPCGSCIKDNMQCEEYERKYTPRRTASSNKKRKTRATGMDGDGELQWSGKDDPDEAWYE